MVKLNAKYLIRRNKANRYFLTRKKGDTDMQFLKRITHLPLQNQFIEDILQINHCDNVKVLYLQHNLLKNIRNMENFPNLTHLYLQRNFLIKIEKLNVLQKLKKIYLGHNEIQVLEGMDQLKQIKEVHLESQDLSAGDTMYFEPLTIRNLGTTLQILNISNNRLISINGLKDLVSLEILNASDNYLYDIDEIVTTISGWIFLQELNLTGNDVTKNKWYRNSIVFASKTLEILDKMPILPNTRTFVENLFERRRNFYAKLEGEASRKKEKPKVLKFKDEDSSERCFELVKGFPSVEPVYSHPPWKLRANVNSVNPKTFRSQSYCSKKEILSNLKTNE